MAHLLGEQTVTVAEYEDLFGLLLRSSDLGHIPQTLDAVVLASAGKMRLDAPDYVFVLGLAEGEFPCAPSETGLLTHADRDVLMAKQIDLPDCFENRVVREQVCVYKALTAPAKGLWLSWPKGQGKTCAQRWNHREACTRRHRSWSFPTLQPPPPMHWIRWALAADRHGTRQPD